MTLITMDDGVGIHVQDLGTGPAVVLISGFGLDCQLWDRQVRVLTAAGYRTVCITQRGHGQSGHPLEGYGIDRLSADVIGVLGALQIDRVMLVGHSFGGMVSFHTAATTPDRVSKLVLVGSNGVRSTRSEGFPFGAPPDAVLPQAIAGEENNRIDARYTLIRSSFAGEPDPRVVNWLMRTWMRMPSWSAIQCYRTLMLTDLLDELPSIVQPVLQISGTADPVHSAKGMHWLQAQLADARVAELDCGHFPMLESPDGFDEALLSFLR